jgi:Tfp pilus assembly PilM family ATPase
VVPQREGRSVARYLALDWDYEQLRVVAATVRAGQLRLEQAAVWQEKQSPNPAEAEALGRQLRNHLKQAGIAPAPVLVCVGRDRVILREVRYPAVAAAEEAGVVRFQVMKELTDSPQEVIIDYAPLGEVGAGEERRAMVLTARHELLLTYQTLCRAAGLKLVAVTPRPFGTLACLHACVKAEERSDFSEAHKDGSAQAAVALLTTAGRWSEFCLVRGDTLLVARSLPEGPNLTAEVRRNIAVYTAQSSRHLVSCLYLAGEGDNGLQPDSLQESLGIPVRCFDPFTGAEGKMLSEPNRGAFAGAVGLLHAQSSGRPLPINFASPKQAAVARDPNKRRLALAAGMAALILFGVATYCYSDLTALDDQIDTLLVQQKTLEAKMPQIKEEEGHLKELNDWSRSNICWLDELYNLTALVPNSSALRAYEIKASTQPPSKDKPIGQLSLKLGSRDAGGETVNRYLEKMGADKHYGTSPKHHIGDMKDPGFPGQFAAQIDVENQPPENYHLHVTAAPATQQSPWGIRTRPVSESNPPGLAKPEHGGKVKYHLAPAPQTGPRPIGRPSPNRVSPMAGSRSSAFNDYMEKMKARQMEMHNAVPGYEVKSAPVDQTEVQSQRQEQVKQRYRELGRTPPPAAPAKEKKP